MGGPKFCFLTWDLAKKVPEAILNKRKSWQHWMVYIQLLAIHPDLEPGGHLATA